MKKLFFKSFIFLFLLFLNSCEDISINGFWKNGETKIQIYRSDNGQLLEIINKNHVIEIINPIFSKSYTKSSWLDSRDSDNYTIKRINESEILWGRKIWVKDKPLPKWEDTSPINP